MKETEKAYWAGLLDGEGCFRKCHNNGYKIPRITLKMTCENTMKAFAKAFDRNIRLVNRDNAWYKDHWKDAWVVDVHGAKAGELCEELLPYFITKREAAQELVDHYVDKRKAP